MSKTSTHLITTVLLLAAGTLCCAEETMALKAGDAAPAFTLPGSDGDTHSLSDHKGKRAVVIAWFPKAFTGG
jgi:peroxiredoxin Q/BCP